MRALLVLGKGVLSLAGVDGLWQEEQVDHEYCKLDVGWYGEAVPPAQVLGDETADQRRKVWPVDHEEGKDPHEEASLVEEVQVTDRCWANGDGGAGPEARECAGGEEAGPVGTISCYQVRYGS